MIKKRTAIRLLALGIFIAICGVSINSIAADISAGEIMEKNFFVSKIRAVKGESTMILVNKLGQTRERKMSSVWTLQNNGIDTNLLMRFSEPSDIRGTSFLQLEHSDGDDDLWIYLPALRKSRRLVANNKKDSFMGSDFSYGDILPPKVELYHHRLLDTETVNGKDCYIIESVPITDIEKTNSGYSKKKTWVDKINYMTIKAEYFDLSNRLFKAQISTNHQLIEPENKRWLAMRREMLNYDTGHKTVLIFDRIEPRLSIPPNYFTTRSMERE